MATGVPTWRDMLRAALGTLALVSVLGGRPLQARDESAEPVAPILLDVNERYTIESVDFSGANKPVVSESILTGFRRLVGEKLNLEALNRLCHQIGGELHANQVTFRLARGSQPEHIKVLFEVEQPRSRFEIDVPSFVYESQQGWTGVAEARATLGANTFSFAVLSDGDNSVERSSGIRLGYERQSLGSDRVKFSISFAELQNRYDRATVAAASEQSAGPILYGGRVDIKPFVTILLAEPLTLTLGYDIEDLRSGSPGTKSEMANAAVTALRYRRQWGPETAKRFLELGYSLRFASRSLGSGYAFVRHELTAHYSWRHDKQTIEANAVAGSLSGSAPIVDQFVLGNSSTLRGWNKYDIDPLGGSRIAHGSLTYGYQLLRVFYDAGAIWSAGDVPHPRQSMGAGFEKNRFLFAVAFPFRAGRVDPVVIAGMKF